MIFIYRKWNKFCKELNKNKILSVTAKKVINDELKKFIIFKHDVETNPKKALKLAKIENKYGHHCTYYVQGYILEKNKNIKYLKEIQNLGHEVTYHLDVMDQCKGNIEEADLKFEYYLKLFKDNGFNIETVCQHGNALIKRDGYYGNRDFFRNKKILNKYPNIYDIMVNFRKKCKEKNYIYISDAGYGWNIISNPETNDINPTKEKNTPIKLEEILELSKKESIIISTHPHRWRQSAIFAFFHYIFFIIIRKTAKILYKFVFFKKIISKFYGIAKKI